MLSSEGLGLWAKGRALELVLSLAATQSSSERRGSRIHGKKGLRRAGRGEGRRQRRKVGEGPEGGLREAFLPTSSSLPQFYTLLHLSPQLRPPTLRQPTILLPKHRTPPEVNPFRCSLSIPSQPPPSSNELCSPPPFLKPKEQLSSLFHAFLRQRRPNQGPFLAFLSSYIMRSSSAWIRNPSDELAWFPSPSSSSHPPFSTETSSL